MAVRNREIHEDDVTAVVDLLTEGFDRDRTYWEHAFHVLKNRPKIEGLPRYGYLLEDAGRIVGALLTIASQIGGRRRCNLSSWYVAPAYRIFGSLMALRAVRQPDVTYFNVSPAPHTWTILEKQGFERFADGRMAVAPWLNKPVRSAKVRQFSAAKDNDHPASTVLQDHLGFGCICLMCEVSGERYPFVFGRQRRWGFFPVVHLVYCRQLSDFQRFAGSLGRYLCARGYCAAILDACGPIDGLPGRYAGNRPRYRKGGDDVHLGDVAYSEQVLFGY